MPKIEVYRDALVAAAGAKKLTDSALEELFPCAKAELDEAADADGIMKVELNDTNRPDLWSTMGLARQLRIYRGGELPNYRFFSDATVTRESGNRRVVVDPSVQEIRPWVVAFVITGPPVTEAVLKDLIQTQEKLTWNYGRKRRSIAMGLYRADLLQWPVHYAAVDPDATRFVPLQMDRELSMREMLAEHPKGQEYGHIVADLPRFPLLTDDRGDVLSFPPVINSAGLGAVQEGDTTLFVELTGTDMDSLLHTAAIVACDAVDAGYTVEPVRVEYPFDTPYGRSITVPFYFQKPQAVALSLVNRLLGTEFTGDEVMAALQRMGIVSTPVDVDGAPGVLIRVPEYRNDFLHAVDIVEDVMIGRGMDSFIPEMPRDFTVGRLTPLEVYRRRVRDHLVGFGFQEMIFNYLGSRRDYIDRMYPPEARDAAGAAAVRIANPMSENYEYVRPSVLASLMHAESVSAHAAYPHHVFAIGKVAERHDDDPSGTRTLTNLGFLSADGEEDFNLVNSRVSALLYYLGVEFTLEEAADPRFITGRAARVVVNNRHAAGVFGEIHPGTLERWGVQVPCTAGELNLEVLSGGL